VLVALRVGNRVVATIVPVIPVVIAGSSGHAILGLIGAALDGDHLAPMDLGAALLGGNVGLAIAHQELSVSVVVDLNAVAALALGMNGNVGRIDLYIGVRRPDGRVACQPLRKLKLNTRAGQRHDVYLSVLVQAKDIGEIELHLGPGSVSG